MLRSASGGAPGACLKLLEMPITAQTCFANQIHISAASESMPAESSITLLH